MKTGSYIYTDGTRSDELDQSKTIAGILCNVTDTLSIGIMPVESEERLNFDEAQQFCQDAGGRCPGFCGFSITFLPLYTLIQYMR